MICRKINHGNKLWKLGRVLGLCPASALQISTRSNKRYRTRREKKEARPDTLDLWESYPCQNDVIQMPRKFRSLDNKTVFLLSVLGEHAARKERLIREVMRVDGTDWSTAILKVEEINKANDAGRSLILLPYRLGMAFGLISAIGSVPMVFHKDCVLWFAKNIVKYPPDEIPPDNELDTMLLVGKFSWEYNEPIIGTLSFVLLGLQLMRAQMYHVGLKPYADFIVHWRAGRLTRKFPQYDKNILTDFAETDRWDK